MKEDIAEEGEKISSYFHFTNYHIWTISILINPEEYLSFNKKSNFYNLAWV